MHNGSVEGTDPNFKVARDGLVIAALVGGVRSVDERFAMPTGPQDSIAVGRDTVLLAAGVVDKCVRRTHKHTQ